MSCTRTRADTVDIYNKGRVVLWNGVSGHLPHTCKVDDCSTYKHGVPSSVCSPQGTRFMWCGQGSTTWVSEVTQCTGMPVAVTVCWPEGGERGVLAVILISAQSPGFGGKARLEGGGMLWNGVSGHLPYSCKVDDCSTYKHGVPSSVCSPQDTRFMWCGQGSTTRREREILHPCVWVASWPLAFGNSSAWPLTICIGPIWRVSGVRTAS